VSSHAHTKPITLEEVTVPKDSLWRKLPLAFGGLGVLCVVLAFVLTGDDSKQFWYSYLTSFMFWLSAGLGGLFFVLIHHGTRAGWSTVIRRLAENYMITLPVLFLLGLPLVFFALEDVYGMWSNPKPNDLITLSKVSYLNDGFFAARYIISGLIWCALALMFYRWSVRQDATGDAGLSHRMRWWAPLGFIGFGVTITVVALDLVMSIDAHWYSTIFGIYYFGGTVMFFMALLSLTALALQRSGMLGERITTEHYHDLGKLGFGFVVFWSYIAFSQFMLIWYANIPETTLWFKHRTEGGWEWFTILLALLHFVVPFFFMMSRHIKRRTTTLAAGCVLLIVAHFLDMFWLAQPGMTYTATYHAHFGVHIADLLLLVGLGGLVLAVFTWRLTSKPLVALKDPRLEESLEFENY